MEFFSPLFPMPDFKSLLKPLKHLQENPGLINDCSVQQASLQGYLREGHEWGDGVELEVAQSVSALIVVLHHRQFEEQGKIVESFAQFRNPQTQEAFRDLFHDRRDKK